MGITVTLSTGIPFSWGEDIVIKDNNLFASDILITSENHVVEPESEHNYAKLDCRKVAIEEGCWICEKAVILPGVHIGKKSVIGCGSIVTSDIPDYSIAVGNPARVIKTYDISTHKWIKIC